MLSYMVTLIIGLGCDLLSRNLQEDLFIKSLEIKLPGGKGMG